MSDQYTQIAAETATHTPRPYYLRSADRQAQVLVLGAAGTASEALLWNLMVADITAGAGVAVLDSTGRYAARLLGAVPPNRSAETYLFQPQSQSNRVPGYNPLRRVAPEQRAKVAQDVMDVFRAVWGLDYERTPLLLDFLRSTTRVLLDQEDASFLGLYALLTNADYRRRAVARCQDPLTRRFWAEFETWPARDQRDRPQPVLTRLRAFLSDPQLRNVLGQTQGGLDIERVVDRRQVLLADFPAASLGSETARLFLALFLVRLKGLLRARTNSWPFYVHIPDGSLVPASLLAGALEERYIAGGLVVRVPGVAPYPLSERSGFLSAGTLIAFRLGFEDARLLSGRFPVAQAETALTNLPARRLAVSGWRYELAALPARPVPDRPRQRAHMLRRSERVLTEARPVVEARIERFFAGL